MAKFDYLVCSPINPGSSKPRFYHLSRKEFLDAIDDDWSCYCSPIRLPNNEHIIRMYLYLDTSFTEDEIKQLIPQINYASKT